MDVRQGVLERNSFKMVYLYNELAALRDQAAKYQDMAETYQSALGAIQRELESKEINIASLTERIWGTLESRSANGNRQIIKEAPPVMQTEPLATEGSAIKRALYRKHKMVQVFSICPAPELVISTAEFWKTAESGQAFRLMYKTTGDELKQFFYRDTPAPDWIRMARVSPEGEVSYLMDF